MVEFAFVLPLFLIFVFLIIDFGYYLFCRISVNNAVRNATRLASLNSSTRAEIAQRVQDSAVGVVIPPGSGTINAVASDPTFPASPPTVTVAVDFPHSFIVAPQGNWSIRCASTFTCVVTTYEAKPSITFSTGSTTF